MRRLWLLLAQHYVWRSAWTGCVQQTLTWVVTYNVFREQIEALIAMSDVCEQEIKFEVFSWNVVIEYIEHFLSVQVGPFEKCCIWGQIWMVDQPTWWEKGDNLLQTNVRIFGITTSSVLLWRSWWGERSLWHHSQCRGLQLWYEVNHWKYWMSLKVLYLFLSLALCPCGTQTLEGSQTKWDDIDSLKSHSEADFSRIRCQ